MAGEIVYNASTGSDTAASGSGPATAITGTGAAHTDGSSSTTITFTNSPSLSGVTSDSVLFLATSSGGRHLTRIVSANDVADTVVVEDAFNIASGSAVNYAIGGKRQTLEADTSRRDWSDATAGWTFELEAGTYALTGTVVMPAVGSTADGPLTVQAASGASPKIAWTGDHDCFTLVANTHLRVVGVEFENVTSTGDAVRMIRAATGPVSLDIRDCTVKTPGTCIWSGITVFGRITGCTLESTRNSGILLDGSSSTLIWNNVIRSCGAGRASSGTGQGIELELDGGSAGVTIIGNIIRDCYANGIDIHSDSTDCKVSILNNAIHDNGDDGIYARNTLDATNWQSIANNILTDNGGYGLHFNTATGPALTCWTDNNAFRGNSSGEVSNVTKGSNSVTLSADPYLDESSDDYQLNDTAGGGAACLDAGYGY